MLGDGFLLVALTWQVYEIDNDPGAMAKVGLALSLAIVVSALFGGMISDRFDRRFVIITADYLRGITIGTMGLLSLAGVLELWHIMIAMALVGFGNMLFYPASFGLVPSLVPADELPQASAFEGTLRPLMSLLIGPAVGGLAVGAFGPGIGILVDAGSYFVAGTAVLGIRKVARPAARPATQGPRQVVEDVLAGLRYALKTRWLILAQLTGMLSIVFFQGPVEVLLPFVVKNDMAGTAWDLGLVYAAGGVAAVITAIVMAQIGLPKRALSVMYLSWASSIAGIALFSVVFTIWQASLAYVFIQSMFTVASIIWITVMQRWVPEHLLGRVSSLDWLLSTALAPLSFALTAPAAAWLGERQALAAAGILGALASLAIWAIPAARTPDRHPPVQAERAAN